MDVALHEIIENRISSNDKDEFIYSIKPVELTNALGSVVAILQEYSIRNKSGQHYTLYKTKEGNWYDMTDLISKEDTAVLRALKIAFDRK